jgi:cobalamin biosynthesis Mg chelatase CobN
MPVESTQTGRGCAAPDEEFDDFLLHVDGSLCKIQDTHIRDGLTSLAGVADQRWTVRKRYL